MQGDGWIEAMETGTKLQEIYCTTVQLHYQVEGHTRLYNETFITATRKNKYETIPKQKCIDLQGLSKRLLAEKS